MYDLLLPSGTKGLREQSICEIKAWELDLKNWKDCRFEDGEWAEFYRIYLFTYGL